MLPVFAGFLLGLFPALFAQAAPAKNSGVWLEVPYVKQTEDGCGSAAIAMLLQYWSAHGTPVAAGRADATAIQKQLYSRKARSAIFASPAFASLPFAANGVIYGNTSSKAGR